jgi:hypothetical protein
MRIVTDGDGIEWRVWAVRPSWADRITRGRASIPGTDSAAGGLMPHAADGWLACESASGERRRIRPLPEGWAELPDAALLAMMAAATPAGQRRRLIE